MRSSPALTGCVLLQALQDEGAPMPTLSKLDAEMRCRLIYHPGFRLSYITHGWSWRRNSSLVTLT